MGERTPEHIANEAARQVRAQASWVAPVPDGDGMPGWRGPLQRIPLNIVVTDTGDETPGVLAAALVSDLDALEAEAADLRAALAAASPREGGGGREIPWGEPYASDPAFLAADEAATTLARSLDLMPTETECMQRGAHELWRLGWRPAGVQVDREALKFLARKIYGEAQYAWDNSVGPSREEFFVREFVMAVASLLAPAAVPEGEQQ